MTDYNFLKDYCSRCHKIQYCVEIYDKKGNCQSLCETCLGWSTLIRAQMKDDLRDIMINCGLQDIENGP